VETSLLSSVCEGAPGTTAGIPSAAASPVLSKPVTAVPSLPGGLQVMYAEPFGPTHEQTIPEEAVHVAPSAGQLPPARQASTGIDAAPLGEAPATAPPFGDALPLVLHRIVHASSAAQCTHAPQVCVVVLIGARMSPLPDSGGSLAPKQRTSYEAS
jgi:hypothetical protein